MMTKQRFGEAADMLNDKFGFDRKPEFMGRKEESLRDLYNFCRDQERRPTITPAKTIADCREVAGRVFCDPAMSGFVMDVHVAEEIAKLLYSRVVAAPPTAPAGDAEPAQPTASRSPEEGRAVADPAG